MPTLRQPFSGTHVLQRIGTIVIGCTLTMKLESVMLSTSFRHYKCFVRSPWYFLVWCFDYTYPKSNCWTKHGYYLVIYFQACKVCNSRRERVEVEIQFIAWLVPNRVRQLSRPNLDSRNSLPTEATPNITRDKQNRYLE